MNIQLGAEIVDITGADCGRIMRLIANQASRQIEMVIIRLDNGREVAVEVASLSTTTSNRLRVNMDTSALAGLPEFDISTYYPLHPVEWQEEWGAVQGEILSLYPPGDADPSSRRRFIIGSLAVIGAITASLVYPVARYLLYPLSKGLPRLWTKITPASELTEDKPQFLSYKVKRIEGYLEENIPKGVWLVNPSPHLAERIALRKQSAQFPAVGWANRPGDIVAFTPKCPHLGCNVHWDAKRHAFLCPCHGSRFDLDGSVIGGPAPRGLDTLPVRMQADQLEIMDMEFRAGIPDKKRSA